MQKKNTLYYIIFILSLGAVIYSAITSYQAVALIILILSLFFGILSIILKTEKIKSEISGGTETVSTETSSISDDLKDGFIRCPECKKIIKEGSSFCPECGFHIPRFLRTRQ